MAGGGGEEEKKRVRRGIRRLMMSWLLVKVKMDGCKGVSIVLLQQSLDTMYTYRVTMYLKQSTIYFTCNLANFVCLKMTDEMPLDLGT